MSGIGIASDGTVVCRFCKNKAGKCTAAITAPSKAGKLWTYCELYKATANAANGWKSPKCHAGCFSLVSTDFKDFVVANREAINAKVAEEERLALLKRRFQASPARSAAAGASPASAGKRGRVVDDAEDDL